MKNYPLSVQIWIVFALITLAITTLLSLIFPLTLRLFFTNEIYSTIESAQNILLNRYPIEDFWNEPAIDGNEGLDDIRTVNHFLVYGDNQILLNRPVSFDLIRQVRKDISQQENVRQRYSGKYSEGKLFYIITKVRSFGRDTYLVSYMGDSYRKDLVKTLFYRLISIMVLIIILSWIPALLLSRYLSSPLVNLESRVDRLAKRDWREPINLGRKDEIGKLGNSVEKLRQELIRQDEAERTFLQNISHELKTPVMIIRSFAQAIKDGIFPKGNLDNSVEVIDEEAERLEKKIENLLYFSKLHYMFNHEMKVKSFPLDSLIVNVIDRFLWNLQDIQLETYLEPLDIVGDEDQWRVVIENILDNQIRYAKEKISISLKQLEDHILLEIWNDGPHIETETMENLFTEYNKGYSGKFGLGLAIVYRILNNHNSSIQAINEDQGVKFIIKIKEEDAN
ncbi:MAG TPA: HAMP domain-containing sensor histidine kinase [Tissierellaceae bacterium]|nr:HAMP domain-containing sensor histidine kinase [Tissierellaceae bacterium]